VAGLGFLVSTLPGDEHGGELGREIVYSERTGGASLPEEEVE
jgi:hypothetical protein